MGGFGKLFNGMAEDFLALHPQMAGGAGRHAAIDIKDVLVAAVGMQVGGQDAAVGGGAGALGRLKHQRAGAVAEQHAGARSVQSISRLKVSAPITSTRRAWPATISAFALESA
jgi:hypothetical protein